MKQRQITVSQTGGVAYGKAQQVAFALRTLGYKADQGYIASAAGMWADTVYIVTDAPLATVRKMATKEGLQLGR